ncbi:hypothetical protein Tco_0537856, partial [Tanacetum coccineum]
DAKTLFEATQARFDGNEATKKNQKTLLKQMYENFSASCQESLDSISNRLQKIVSQLAILDLGTISFDDLYNNFKIVEQEDSTASTHVSTTSTNNSTASLSDANQPNRSQVVHEDLEQIHEDDLEEMDLKWQLALLSLKVRKFYQRTGKKIIINGSYTAGYDKSKVVIGFYMVDEEVRTNLALMSFSDSKFDLATYKRGLASVEEQLVFYKKNEVMLCDQIVVLKRDASFKDSEINALNIQIEKFKKEKESNQIKIDYFENASKSQDKLIGSQISDNNRKSVGYNVVPPPPTGLFAPPTIDLSNSSLKEFQHPEFEGYRFKANKDAMKIPQMRLRKLLMPQ